MSTKPTSSLKKDFLAGMDPFGTFSGEFGQRAEQNQVGLKEHAKKITATTAGGVIGGAVVVPSAITGGTAVLRSLATGSGGVGKRILDAGSAGIRGAAAPFKGLVRAHQTKGLLSRAAASGSTSELVSDKGQKILREFSEVVPLSAVIPDVRKGLDTQNLAERVRKGVARSGTKVIPENLEALMPIVNDGISSAHTQLALGGGLGAAGAALPYYKGVRAEQGFQDRMSSEQPRWKKTASIPFEVPMSFYVPDSSSHVSDRQKHAAEFWIRLCGGESFLKDPPSVLEEKTASAPENPVAAIKDTATAAIQSDRRVRALGFLKHLLSKNEKTASAPKLTPEVRKKLIGGAVGALGLGTYGGIQSYRDLKPGANGMSKKEIEVQSRIQQMKLIRDMHGQDTPSRKEKILTAYLTQVQKAKSNPATGAAVSALPFAAVGASTGYNLARPLAKK